MARMRLFCSRARRWPLGLVIVIVIVLTVSPVLDAVFLASLLTALGIVVPVVVRPSWHCGDADAGGDNGLY
ncbi:hypothetical protein [Streptomyces sp. ERV7]|uniref:hypothetical protein n=1 Tax=Streptomyces sp. ERV7 TaxID=1322334 RepID=UPI00131DA878|nr:hypothetical protein [Streptomyces sp. ERV7]